MPARTGDLTASGNWVYGEEIESILELAGDRAEKGDRSGIFPMVQRGFEPVYKRFGYTRRRNAEWNEYDLSCLPVVDAFRTFSQATR